MKSLMTFGSIALLAIATACGNTADGVKEDTENAADKTAEASAEAGASMGAAMETADVKTALTTDARVDASDINVNTNADAKTVTLNGTVPTEAQKTVAAEIATAQAPGYTVVNNLTIKAP